MMVATKMLREMVLLCKPTLRSNAVSVTARGIAVPNLGCILIMMDTYVALKVSLSLERAKARTTFDKFPADMRLITSALSRSETRN